MEFSIHLVASPHACCVHQCMCCTQGYKEIVILQLCTVMQIIYSHLHERSEASLLCLKVEDGGVCFNFAQICLDTSHLNGLV